MIRVWGILFGIAVALATALMVTATFAKATEKFERHVPTRMENIETAARSWGANTDGGSFNHKSHPVFFVRGSEEASV